MGEARSDLALCYWRSGAYDEARVILQEALREFDESDIELNVDHAESFEEIHLENLEPIFNFERFRPVNSTRFHIEQARPHQR